MSRRQKSSTRWSRLLSEISVDGAIDRVFRFIEMILITALIGVAFRVVSAQAATWIVTVLALLAGLYLGVPSAKWITAHILQVPKGREGTAVAVISLGIGFAAVIATSGLRILLSETFQIDAPKADVEYKLWEARSSLRDCRSPLGPNPPPRDTLTCESRWRVEINKLEAKERSLNR